MQAPKPTPITRSNMENYGKRKLKEFHETGKLCLKIKLSDFCFIKDRMIEKPLVDVESRFVKRLPAIGRRIIMFNDVAARFIRSIDLQKFPEKLEDENSN